MNFSIEMLQAKKGDSMILHYGTNDIPKIAIFDGGPGWKLKSNSVYFKSLRPRLMEIKNKFYKNKPLPIELITISHVDDDHIYGILQLLDEIIEAKDKNKPLPFIVKNIWFNSFEKITRNPQVTSANLNLVDFITKHMQTLEKYSWINESSLIFLFGIGQGKQLVDRIDELKIPVNKEFKYSYSLRGKLVRTYGEKKPILLNKKVRTKIINPDERILKLLQSEWGKHAKLAAPNDVLKAFKELMDNRYVSTVNLSSIVCHYTYDGKSILLTGDALDNDIILGLKRNKLLDNKGQIMVDVLQVPHHGSDQNVSTNFFRKVRAKNYLISSDGSNKNPDLSTLEMISEGTKGRNNFTLHFTNSKGKDKLEQKLIAFMKKEKKNGRTYKFNFIDKTKKSIVLDLKDKLTY